jgi:hypothetical protein
MRAFAFNAEQHLYTWVDTGEIIPSVNQILQTAGLVDFSKIPAEIMKAAQDRGTNIHLATQFDDLGTLDTVDPAHQPYLEGWRQFRTTFGIKFTAKQIEVACASEVHNFAGTMDRVCVDFETKQVWIIDLKSGSAVYRSTGLQLAGYEILVKENFPELVGFQFIRWAVQLKKSGALKYKIHSFKDPGDIGTFIGCKNGDTEIIQAWLQRAA